MQDQENSHQLYKCHDCGAVYDDHTLPRKWVGGFYTGDLVAFCRSCNGHPPNVQPIEEEE